MAFKSRHFCIAVFAALVLCLSGQQAIAGDQNSKQETKKPDKKKSAKNPKDDPDEVGNRDVGKGINFYSIEKEIALGKQLAQEVEKSAKLVDDPVIAEYVNRVGQNIVRNSDAKVPFTIKVLDSEEVNAFALPGGFFFVNSGLISKAENEAELASVMAHEIAHVAARHGTRQATRGAIANYASLPLIFMGGGAGYAIYQAAGLAIPLTFLNFSRGFEREADYLGLQYLYKAGYDPNTFVDFFERIESLERKKPGTLSKVFATHPLTDDRIKKTQADIEHLGLASKPEYVINTSEFVDVKGRLQKKLNLKKGQPEDKEGRPTLRREGSGKIGEEQPDKPDKDERPTLKRRDE